jgi:hypothetical protein
MTWLILAATAVVVFVIAAVVVGREARRLDAVAPRVTYELDEAVVYVADRLPQLTQARLGYDDVREVLRIHMRLLHAHGHQPDRLMDRPQDIEDVVLVDDTGAIGEVIGAVESAGLDLVDEDVAAIVDAHLAYLDFIGAVGPQAPPDELGADVPPGR